MSIDVLLTNICKSIAETTHTEDSAIDKGIHL